MVCSLWFVVVPELDPAFPPGGHPAQGELEKLKNNANIYH
jgi:hypothetical protein